MYDINTYACILINMKSTIYKIVNSQSINFDIRKKDMKI